MSEFIRNYYSLPPIGAGDLIDRAVRLYRQHFLTFFFIASLPVIIGTLFSTGWWLVFSFLFYIERETLSANLLVLIGNLAFWFIEMMLILSVMGGASRNFVRHIIFGTPFSFRETYSNTFSKFFSLLSASFLILTNLLLFATLIFSFLFPFLIGFSLYFIYSAFGEHFISLFLTILAFPVWLFFLLKLFFMVASRFAYILQIMMVEGRNFSSAISRSFSLAKGSTNRVYALFVFTFFATMSALALFYMPLLLYAYYVSGMESFILYSDNAPMWYLVANALVFQLSLILISPVLMIGLSLLYIDSRIKQEGYDIELMAKRVLGEIPSLPERYRSPLEPALVEKSSVKESVTLKIN
jgi:hypothetical protein